VSNIGWKFVGDRTALELQRANEDAERRRIQELSKPPAPNPPHLLKPTDCRVLKPFGLAGGKVARVGEVVTLPKHDADSMRALGRVEILG